MFKKILINSLIHNIKISRERTCVGLTNFNVRKGRRWTYLPSLSPLSVSTSPL